MASSAPSASSALPHLLVVDDDPEITSAIARYFGKHGFRVSAAGDGAAMRETIGSEAIDVVLLDLGLPTEDGFELIPYLREQWNGAIVVVTGRAESVDRVVGLELGADDYVAKPFDLRELLARVRSVLRRVHRLAEPQPNLASAVPGMEFAGFRFDVDMRSLTDAGGRSISLTTSEFDLLRVLLSHANRVLSRDQIMSEMRGRDSGPYDRTIDVQIGRLRRKIERDPATPQLIKSVRNAGYVLTAHVQRH